MTNKTVVIKYAGAEIIIDRRDLKNLDLSLLRITNGGYVLIGKKLLHRIIMSPPDDLQIDHKNKNTLDNRRSNLRICTHSQNQMNRGRTRANRSGYKGVGLEKGGKKYRARITANKKTHYLGSFEKPADAGKVYKEAAKTHHGEYVRINDPKKPLPDNQ